jgi:ankyrin repeat protein
MKDLSLIHELINNGVDVNEYIYTGETPLSISVFINHPEIVRCLLAHGANPNQSEAVAHQTNETPLIVAIKENSIESIKLLLEYGADPYIKDGRGNNSLFYVLDSLDKQIIDLFIESKKVGDNDRAKLKSLRLDSLFY